MNRASRSGARALPVRGVPLWRLALVAWVLASACTKSKDTYDPEPPERGAVQPDGGGARLSEPSACNQLKAAESAARSALNCAPVSRACPAFIRPAGGEGCFEYSEASVKACAALYGSFTRCEDFTTHPCLLSAVSECDGEPAEGAAGAGPVGSAGSAGEGDGAGVPGSAGEGGAAGASGAGGEGG